MFETQNCTICSNPDPLLLNGCCLSCFNNATINAFNQLVDVYRRNMERLDDIKRLVNDNMGKSNTDEQKQAKKAIIQIIDEENETARNLIIRHDKVFGSEFK